MCGIVSVVGVTQDYNAVPLVLSGLYKLEYRGYDSAGIGIINAHGQCGVYRSLGKISTLADGLTARLSFDNTAPIVDPISTHPITETSSSEPSSNETRSAEPITKTSIANPSSVSVDVLSVSVTDVVGDGIEPFGYMGIGHTRWATHGKPSIANAHPHRYDDVVLVHNGVIENMRCLKDTLIHEGFVFNSDTDTEVVAALCAYHVRLMNGDYQRAVTATVAMLEGAFALCFMFVKVRCIVAVSHGLSLVLGKGDPEQNLPWMVASDTGAMPDYIRDVYYLTADDCVCLSLCKVELYRLGEACDVHWKQRQQSTQHNNEKGSYPHYMAKEIAEQPSIIRGLLTTYLDNSYLDNAHLLCNTSFLSNTDIRTLHLIACGSAHYACLVARHWFETIAGVHTNIEVASEFRYRSPLLHPQDVGIFVSQSGETADTLAALFHCQRHDIPTFAVVNAEDSMMVRRCRCVFPIKAGSEIGVAATKTFTAQLATLFIMAMVRAQKQGQLSHDAHAELVNKLRRLPHIIEKTLQLSPVIKNSAEWLSQKKSLLVCGRGIMHPVALEGALKIKEIGYIHAEGCASGELKHGLIALIENDFPVIMLIPGGALFAKSLSNMHEILARGARVIAITDEEHYQQLTAISERVDTIVVPHSDEQLTPITYTIVLQQLAYAVALAKKTHIDQPRNLAKSVTVE